MLATEDFNVETAGQGDICDISQRIADAVSGSGLSAGVVTATVIGSTAAITTIEFEPGAVTDLGTALEDWRLVMVSISTISVGEMTTVQAMFGRHYSDHLSRCRLLTGRCKWVRGSKLC